VYHDHFLLVVIEHFRWTCPHRTDADNT